MEALVLSDGQAEELDAVGFQRATPQRDISAERYAKHSQVHYGCSPGFDVDVRDRRVLPPEQGVIKRCALVEFVGLPVAVEYENGEAEAPAYSPDPESISGPADRRQVAQRTKLAGDCAEEVRFAYANTNPWGFVVFDALTGRGPEEAFEIFRSVLPKRMSLPDMIARLEDLTVEGAAAAVRDQLLTGAQEAARFARSVLDASEQEIADRKAGSQGKPKFDRRDERAASALGESLPEVRPAPKVQAPAGLDSAALDALLKTAEENGRLKAELAAKGKAKAQRAE